MARQTFQDELVALRENVLYMSEVVSERLRLGLDALEQKDHDLAQSVIEGDAEVNELYLELEGDCIDLLALQQPVAGDLRLVASSFKITTDLERIADLASNLGEYTKHAHHDVFTDVDVQAIGDESLAMLADAMTAYEQEDAEACFAIAERDDELDRLCAQASENIVRELIETEYNPADERDIEELMAEVRRLLLTVRDLERVGDHCVNIAARTLYMIENDDQLLY